MKRPLTFSPLSLFLLTVVVLLALPGCKADLQKSSRLEVPGTGACEQILKIMARSFNQANPGLEVVIPKSVGSSGGIREVGEGNHILARTSRPIEGQEAAYGLTTLDFAMDAVVFAVSREIELSDISTEQAAAIFSGRVKTWPEVGCECENSIICPLIREESDSSLAIIKKHLAGYKVPKQYLFKDTLGRAPNGKADYKAITTYALDTLGIAS